MKHVAALVVTGGRGVLAELGAPEDAALTPFAGTYRFIDFALAAAVNAGISAVVGTSSQLFARGSFAASVKTSTSASLPACSICRLMNFRTGASPISSAVF